MESKPPYNKNVNRIHNQNGPWVCLKESFTGNELWNGPVKKGLTLRGLTEKLRVGDDRFRFFCNEEEIPSHFWDKNMKFLHNDFADDPEKEGEPRLLTLSLICSGGQDLGLLKVTKKGEAQSLKNTLAMMKDQMAKREIRGRCTEALALAMASEEEDLEKVQVLLQEGADTEKKDNCGNTAVLSAAEKGRTGLVRCLVDGGAALEAKNEKGNTALLLAALHGFPGTLRLLLEKKANMHATNQEGNMAIQLAASVGHDDIVIELVKRGAEVNTTNKENLTALHLAAKFDHTSTIELLLENTADISARKCADPHKASTALQLAARYGHATTAMCLKKHLEKLIPSRDPTNIWQQKQVARIAKPIVEEISAAIKIAKQMQHGQVEKLLKETEPKDNGSEA